MSALPLSADSQIALARAFHKTFQLDHGRAPTAMELCEMLIDIAMTGIGKAAKETGLHPALVFSRLVEQMADGGVGDPYSLEPEQKEAIALTVISFIAAAYGNVAKGVPELARIAGLGVGAVCETTGLDRQHVLDEVIRALKTAALVSVMAEEEDARCETTH